MSEIGWWTASASLGYRLLITKPDPYWSIQWRSVLSLHYSKTKTFHPFSLRFTETLYVRNDLASIRNSERHLMTPIEHQYLRRRLRIKVGLHFL
jgi:hypothetical protein